MAQQGLPPTRAFSLLPHPFSGRSAFLFAQTLVAIRTYYLKHEALPEDLAVLPDLVPTEGDASAWITDPRCDKPLVYRRADDSFIVYGLGTDNSDEDGNIGTGDRRTATDVGFRVALPGKADSESD